MHVDLTDSEKQVLRGQAEQENTTDPSRLHTSLVEYLAFLQGLVHDERIGDSLALEQTISLYETLIFKINGLTTAAQVEELIGTLETNK